MLFSEKLRLYYFTALNLLYAQQETDFRKTFQILNPVSYFPFRAFTSIILLMKTPFIIDAHEDLAYESLRWGFDYAASVAYNRKKINGPDYQSTIGWPELQKGRVGIIFGTIFLDPPYEVVSAGKKVGVNYSNTDEYHVSVCAQLDFYDRLQEEHHDEFRRIFSRADYDQIVRPLIEDPENEHTVGLIGLLEGAEGLRSFDDLELYRNRGVHLVGPVWGGGRWCAGTKSRDMKDALTDEGKTLLQKMSALGLVLDISHMKNHSAMDSLDYYDGIVAASHANCNALLHDMPIERHLNDETIRMLISHDGVMGVIPFNFFLSPNWKYVNENSRREVTLNMLADHIDHICQLAGDSGHAAIGSDFDGGFGYPEIPYEMNDISDLQKLSEVLDSRGYGEKDIENIFSKNWQRILERALK